VPEQGDGVKEMISSVGGSANKKRNEKENNLKRFGNFSLRKSKSVEERKKQGQGAVFGKKRGGGWKKGITLLGKKNSKGQKEGGEEWPSTEEVFR